MFDPQILSKTGMNRNRTHRLDVGYSAALGNTFNFIHTPLFTSAWSRVKLFVSHFTSLVIGIVMTQTLKITGQKKEKCVNLTYAFVCGYVVHPSQIWKYKSCVSYAALA